MTPASGCWWPATAWPAWMPSSAGTGSPERRPLLTGQPDRPMQPGADVTRRPCRRPRPALRAAWSPLQVCANATTRADAQHNPATPTGATLRWSRSAPACLRAPAPLESSAASLLATPATGHSRAPKWVRRADRRCQIRVYSWPRITLFILVYRCTTAIQALIGMLHRR